jgi:hypothetical protein
VDGLKLAAQRVDKELGLVGKLVVDEGQPRVDKERPLELVELKLGSRVRRLALGMYSFFFQALPALTLYTSRLSSTQFLYKLNALMYFLAPRSAVLSATGRPSGPMWRDSLRKTLSVL